ncbi:MAG TPA: SDR family NAD(P)-dependent oxidoreductase [Dehalococcoidia bacterium]|jgi:NAD(P)-dependent dehydrogenase (short-subunit alcohol dehydrogenase family)
MSLEGKVVFITGAARGMGREYVRGFLKEGARVAAADLTWTPSGVSNDDFDFAGELSGDDDALVLETDLTIDSHVKHAYAATMQRFGTVDVVISNAGLRQRNLYPPSGAITVLETEIGDWQRMIDSHLYAALRVIKLFVQPMIERRSGSIIVVGSSSVLGQNPATREQPYKAAKAALTSMSMYLAHEVKPYNVAVNVLVPGGSTRSTGSDEQQAGRAELNARLSSGTMSWAGIRANADHVVPLALHLAQQDASTLTGQEINAMRWNEEHGLGGIETWGYAPDLERARAAGRL